jgi:hypothetical protein
MSAPGEEQRSGERPATERAAHQAERDDTVEDTVGVDRREDAGHPGVEHVRDDDQATIARTSRSRQRYANPSFSSAR